MSAAPATLDFEGSVSSVNRRQAQARWTFPLLGDRLTGAVALENPEIILDLPPGVEGEERTPSPDLIGRVRWQRDWGQFQAAALVRKLGFQAEGEPVVTGTAWGMNLTGVTLLTRESKGYFQPADSLDRTRYLAANLIWNPIERVNIGLEYPYGVRKNVDGGEGHANRLQGAFIFDLP